MNDGGHHRHAHDGKGMSRLREGACDYLLPHLKPRMKVLDVGCGSGRLTRQLAEQVEQGTTVGIDISQGAIDKARLSTSTGADFRVADVYDLPFPDGSFDVVHSHQVFHHLAHPVTALREMRRVLARGGLLAVSDSIHRMHAWHPASCAIEEWHRLFAGALTTHGADADAGLLLASWARHAGFDDLALTCSTQTISNPDDAARWADTWAQRMEQSWFADEVRRSLTDDATLTNMAAGWRAWGSDPNAVFIQVFGEVIARR